ncbi:saccharopine dehydrogenase NADP-binding domain-containing protein [Paenibacillus sp. FSL L8-0340]|uniref:saccharopine dehydrogenase family protein n=1 Tax=Paenibacillus sp. FSL L8-0340 TaxID=2954685 RepID=UPI0031580D08
MKTDIVVVGGYGHVGAEICRLLGEQHPGVVYAAGRSLERAEQFCRTSGGKVKPLRLSVGEAIDEELLKRTKLVVMCLDQQDTSFAEACLRSGTHYVDVSANGEYFRLLQSLGDTAAGLKGTAVLSVGLAPGLTNLLSLKAVNELDRCERIDISIMLGLGDSHGQAALEWTVDSLGSAFERVEQGRKVAARSFTERKQVNFGGTPGTRKTYLFPFSDQQILPYTLKVPSVATRLCFDSRAATSGIALMRKIGLTALFRNKVIRKLTVQAFGKLRLGSEQYAVKVDAYGVRGGKAVVMEAGIEGIRESVITARVAAGVALSVYEETHPAGIHHIEQLFKLQANGTQLSLSSAAGASGRAEYPLDGLTFWSGVRSQ